MAHEAFHFLKVKKSHCGMRVALKLDMNKDHDIVEWSILHATLLASGFDQAWVDRILTLVTLVTYIYQVNGFRTRYFIPLRGLRQEDPLSPCLFNIIFNVLSRLISDAPLNSLFSGIKLAPQAPILTHLFFCRWC